VKAEKGLPLARRMLSSSARKPKSWPLGSMMISTKWLILIVLAPCS
jgi:hypothetical protein